MRQDFANQQPAGFVNKIERVAIVGVSGRHAFSLSTSSAN